MTRVSVLILIFLSSVGCPVRKQPVSDNIFVPFCEVVDSPARYESTTFRTEAIILGYHDFIGYDPDCLGPEKTIRVDLDYDQRSRIALETKSKRDQYQSSVFRDNVYAKIIMTGTLHTNADHGSNKNEISPAYQFTVATIDRIAAMEEEVAPNE